MTHPAENAILPEELVNSILQAYTDSLKPLLTEPELEEKYQQLRRQLGLQPEQKSPK
jgi:hypothetical protein